MNNKAISPIVLQSSKLPKMLGELTHSNQFLKMFSLAVLCVAVLTLVTLALLVSRPPVILTLTPDAGLFSKGDLPKAEDQVRAAVHRYLEKRYNWDPENVDGRLNEAQAFILPQSLKAFRQALADVARFSKEKQVSQRTYANKVQVDLAQKTVLVTGDRVSAIQGLKAAGNLNLLLYFDAGPRTTENPWGLYITKEKEEQ